MSWISILMHCGILTHMPYWIRVHTAYIIVDFCVSMRAIITPLANQFIDVREDKLKHQFCVREGREVFYFKFYNKIG